MIKAEKVLLLCPHPDDEVGCAGTIDRFLGEGKKVFYVSFSYCEASAPSGCEPNFLKPELQAARKALGVKNTLEYSLAVRHFPEHRQEILELMAWMKSTIEPDLVLVPHLRDGHQDHHTIAVEATRAFRHESIFGYEHPMRPMDTRHVCYVRLKEKHLETKYRVMDCYASQKFRHYWDKGLYESLAKVRGAQAGVKFAEAFEVIQMRV